MCMYPCVYVFVGYICMSIHVCRCHYLCLKTVFISHGIHFMDVSGHIRYIRFCVYVYVHAYIFTHTLTHAHTLMFHQILFMVAKICILTHIYILRLNHEVFQNSGFTFL